MAFSLKIIPLLRSALGRLVLAGSLALALPLRADERPAAGFPALLDARSEDGPALFPLEAAINGENDPRLATTRPDDLGAAYRAKAVARCDRCLAALAGLDRAAPSESGQLSYDSPQGPLTLRREGTRRILPLLPINPFSRGTLTFAPMGSGAGIARGLFPTREPIERVLPQLLLPEGSLQLGVLERHLQAWIDRTAAPAGPGH